MTKLPTEKTYREQCYAVLLWVMTILYFYFISLCSAKPAELSTNESRAIVEGTLDIVRKTVTIVSDRQPTIVSYTSIVNLVRKSSHILNFCIFGFLCSMTVFHTNSFNLQKVFKLSILCGLLGAIIDEGHQFFVPGRCSELQDVLIDFAGVYIGCITFYLGLCYFLKNH